MATIALLGAAQLLVLGIIGEYVGRTLREARGRPTYIVGETEAEQKPKREVIGFRRPGGVRFASRKCARLRLIAS